MSSGTSDDHGHGVHFRPLGWVAVVVLCSTVWIGANSFLTRRRAEAQAVAELRAAARGRAADEKRSAEERARREAPDKLRALLTSLPALHGTYRTGYGPTAVTLNILTFNSETGAVTAEAEFAPENGKTKRANGAVSGDRLELTVLALSDSKPWILMRLRYDGMAGALEGQWFNADSDGGSGLLFPLR